MSSANSVQLTEEQEKFLNALEEEFKDRYTENDEDFKAALNEKLPEPPIVVPWGDFRNRDGRNDNYRQRHNRYHSYHDRYDRGDSHRSGRRYDTYSRDNGGGYSRSSRDDHRRQDWNYYSDSYRS